MVIQHKITKEVKSNQKHPSCKKKSVRPRRRPLWKKMWNLRWWPRNGCDGKLIAKILITTIQVNLMLNLIWRRQHKFTWIVIIKIFAINLLYHHSRFLAATLDFTSFFTMAFLGVAHFFYSLAVFGLDNF